MFVFGTILIFFSISSFNFFNLVCNVLLALGNPLSSVYSKHDLINLFFEFVYESGLNLINTIGLSAKSVNIFSNINFFEV